MIKNVPKHPHSVKMCFFAIVQPYKALYKKFHLYSVLITSIYDLLEKCKQRKDGLKTAPVGARNVAILEYMDKFGVIFFNILIEDVFF